MSCRRRFRWILSKLDLEEEAAILDCGCGDGLYAGALARASRAPVFALDRDPENLARTRTRLPAGAAVRLVHGDAQAIPFPDDAFDAVIFTEVLEHVPDDRRALREIRRVLKPGGALILTVPNHDYPFLWDPLNYLLEALLRTHVRAGLWAGIWNMHLRLYGRTELRALLASEGFAIEEEAALTHYCVPMNHVFLYALKKLLDRRILPPSIQNAGDKFAYDAPEQSRLVHFGYAVLGAIDRWNDRLPPDRSSVNLGFLARKPGVRVSQTDIPAFSVDVERRRNGWR
ncbi:MAG: class I SAM-dependent methyltransferase [Planctomycetes bacterium]|nr:class I SAM-dependent methyltransferase [Planctomycetota bacterium]